VLEYQGKVYSATLNQTSVQNNNNKYYIIQVLQSDTNPNTCFLFTRWGRVGVKGQSSNIGTNQMGGISAYNSKYHEKHKKGDYREIDLNYGEEVVEVKDDAPPRD
jgi:poly [ADP-ribose] polymerase